MKTIEIEHNGVGPYKVNLFNVPFAHIEHAELWRDLWAHQPLILTTTDDALLARLSAPQPHGWYMDSLADALASPRLASVAATSIALGRGLVVYIGKPEPNHQVGSAAAGGQ